MQIVVLGGDSLFNELKTGNSEADLIQIITPGELMLFPQADAYFDLEFENTAERIALLSRFLPRPVFINSIIAPLTQSGNLFIRINGWPSFLQRKIIEAACLDSMQRGSAEKICNALNKTIEWVPDVPGFVSARVVSMIINEAYFALQQNVSTKKEMDTAMKLGTNYPFGPFEWSEKIGLKNIYDLLTALAETNTRYQPAELLKKEVLQ